MSARIGSAAVLRALSVLVRKHPKAAFDMLCAGLGQAARTSAHEMGQKVSSWKGVKYLRYFSLRRTMLPPSEENVGPKFGGARVPVIHYKESRQGEP